MPIYHAVEQREEEWFRLRIGRPTASEFHRILTAGGKISAQATDYAHMILAEMMLGKRTENPATEWMIRGQELEDSAIEAYEHLREVETARGGFVTTDDGRVGCSPDRLVGDDGLIEMKCPAPNTHIGYLLDPASLEGAKKPQVQGELCVTGRRWVDLVSYHPELPTVIRRVYRDDKYIESLGIALTRFVEILDELRFKLEWDYGPFPAILISPKKTAAEVDDALGVGDDDIDFMISAGAIRPLEK